MQTTQITASYEDTLKYIKNSINDDFLNAVKLFERFGIPASMTSMASANKTVEMAKVVAFIFGKSDNQVLDDISKMVNELKEGK